MPQSLSKVVIHIIFSHKDRHPWLDASVRPECTPILRPSAATQAQMSFASAGLPIMSML
jgi:hypothetical protein